MKSKMKVFEEGVGIMEYFINLFSSIGSRLYNDISQIFSENLNYSKFQVFFEEHSLAGAIATISSYQFSKFQKFEKKNSPVLITYGSPIVGNKEFVNKIDEKVPYILIVVKHHDIVPTLPPHFGKNSFKHTKGLIMIPDARQSLFYCDTIEKNNVKTNFLL